MHHIFRVKRVILVIVIAFVDLTEKRRGLLFCGLTEISHEARGISVRPLG